MNDTICSIATTLGVGAISIIRVSGNEALKIVSKIFSKNLVDVSTHTIHYGYIKNKEEIIDEVLVSVMLKPKTYTMEDVVEINCHGGIETTNKVLELLLLNGCRLAEPGEFTKRAFLNGRIDLMQAEAVSDLINSKTDKARKIAINGLRGNGSNLIKKLREDLINIISNIEVNIDYPEYEDIYEITIKDIKEKVLTLKNSLTKIINEYEDAKIIQDGILTAIVGRPNVGKSSLLNRLLNEEKAIVTNIEGTTRDIVEGEILIDGIKINIIDTAGIRKTDDVVESIGVKKSLDIINKATLTLLLLDNSKELTKDDLELLEMTKDRTSIVVINKDDLESKLDLTKLKDRNIIYINTLSNDGIENLKNEIKKLFNLEKLDTSDYNYITNVRQIAKIKECLVNIEDIEKGLQENTPLDMLEIDLKTIWDTLGSIIGESYDEELLDNLFSKFCVGK
ncbi:MAG: tRNA uridine-5-carboxymethylaminomethyl(34) synthesis GTPase MnmE [Erysipelotrichaceae bacterium]|nr:tRNA uridine-5-carboxymethylaminomethyl(34) synthesis GTPase MnmE [Erysipelotrichaceae bacterium]